MTTPEDRNVTAFRSWLLACWACLRRGIVPSAAQQQQQQQQMPKGWFKACAKQEDVDICNVQNIVSASTGQVVTGVSLMEIKGKVNRRSSR